jgi:hypothetical protein
MRVGIIAEIHLPDENATLEYYSVEAEDEDDAKWKLPLSWSEQRREQCCSRRDPSCETPVSCWGGRKTIPNNQDDPRRSAGSVDRSPRMGRYRSFCVPKKSNGVIGFPQGSLKLP